MGKNTKQVSKEDIERAMRLYTKTYGAKNGDDFAAMRAVLEAAARKPRPTNPMSEEQPTVPANEVEAQNGLNDIFLNDPYPVASILRRIRLGSVQALHAGLSRRDWHATETAANRMRDELDRLLQRMGVSP